MSSVQQPSAIVQRSTRVTDQRLYLWAAFAAFVIVFVGFSKTFFLRILFNLPPLPWVLIGHGVLMTGWFGLYFVQTALVRSHQVTLHRRLGMLSIGYVVLVVISGLAVAIHAGARDVLDPGALPFMGMLFILMGVFAVLVAGAFLLRHRRDYHKRLMLLSLLSMISPGPFRIPVEVLGSFGFLKTGGFFGLFSIHLLLLYGCVLWDTWSHRRLHPAFAAGGLLIVAENTPLMEPIVTSPAWLHLARWLVT
jgi:hypothetical protein